METKPMMTAEQRVTKQLNDSKDLQDRQIRAAEGDEDAVKMISGNRDSKSKIKETDKDYIHVAVVTRNLDADNKVFHDEARVIKIQPRIFPQMIINSAFAAFDEVKVIHDPRPNAPKDYNLKPLPLKGNNPFNEENKANDAALAAREQKVKDAERSLDAKIAELNKLMAQQQQAAKTPTKQATSGQAVTKQTPPAGDAKIVDLPPLPDNLGEQAGPVKPANS